MASHIKNMTQGKPVSLIFSFALPLMIGNVFQQLYTVVDTMVVGKALGVGALAALGAADWLNWMMLGIIQGFTQGFGILMAQEFGAGRHDNLRKSIGASTVLLSCLPSYCWRLDNWRHARSCISCRRLPRSFPIPCCTCGSCTLGYLW